MNTLDMVREFHESFGCTVKHTPDVTNANLNELRCKLIEEEAAELREALEAGDVVEALDALCDLQYVIDGAFLALGLHPLKEPGMTEVHRSNMSKLGIDGKPILREDGKILKGPNYSKPDLTAVVEKKAA